MKMTIKWMDKYLEEYMLIILSGFLVIMIFAQVFMRYIFDAPISWSEEIARFVFVWFIYVGVSAGVKYNRHLGVDAFKLLFKKKGETLLCIIANVLFLIFAVLITYHGIKILGNVSRSSAALQIPFFWVYLAPVIGMFLTAIRLIQNITIQIKAL